MDAAGYRRTTQDAFIAAIAVGGHAFLHRTDYSGYTRACVQVGKGDDYRQFSCHPTARIRRAIAACRATI